MTTTNRSTASPILTARAADVALRRYLDARATGRRLAWAREATGISQAELGAYVGVSAATIYRIERGRRVLRPSERAATARALGCSIATLRVDSPNGNGRAAW
jgi:DNA-binding XRE family transcriptional regulator